MTPVPLTFTRTRVNVRAVHFRRVCARRPADRMGLLSGVHDLRRHLLQQPQPHVAELAFERRQDLLDLLAGLDATYWDDPHGFVKGWLWYSPGGFEPAVSPLYPAASYGKPYRMNGLGIVDFQQFDGQVTTIQPWPWGVDWAIGYNMYASAWARLYAWVDGKWVSDFFQVPVFGSPTDSPGYCFNP